MALSFVAIFRTKNTKPANSYYISGASNDMCLRIGLSIVGSANFADTMNNICTVFLISAGFVGGTLESALMQSASKTGIKTVVLVHGAFADGSDWEAHRRGCHLCTHQPISSEQAFAAKYEGLPAHG